MESKTVVYTPEKQKKSFMKFAKQFGFTEEKIEQLLKSES